MQRLPRFTKAVLFVAIAFGALQLRNVARGWQEPATKAAPADKAPETAPAPEPNADAVALVKSARERLSKWQSIRANVVQTVDFGDRRFKASGQLLIGEFPRLRLEYELKVGNTVGNLLEVCDGQVLHIERRIEEAGGEKPAVERSSEETEVRNPEKPAVEVTRRDVQRILRATTDAEKIALSTHAADIGLGGLSSLLASLDRTMIFDSIRDEEHAGQKFRVVQGIWNPTYLAELQAKLGGVASQLAMFLPERVRIYFEAESLFPVRILYLQRASQERRTFRAMLSLEFHDVEFDVPLPADAFTYRPPTGQTEKDDTEEFIQMLKASQGQAPPPSEPAAPPGSQLNLKRSTESAKPK